jgi:pyruvate/2-oxoacid:ferredoxin oxidoreductase alpha subunit
MKKQILITGNAAAAWGARLSSADYIPAFPITPQTEIIETLSDWIHRNEMDAHLTMFESETFGFQQLESGNCRVWFYSNFKQGLMYEWR